MRYLIQHPHPDELLGSVWIRSRRRAGVGIGLATRMITGRKFSPSMLSYAHVVDLAAALDTASLNLLWRHSIFPYAVAYVTPKVFESSLARALSTGHASKGCGSTVQSVSDHVRCLRFCRDCAIEDEQRWGESYWRREHQLPGVRVCTRHWKPLIETAIHVSQLRPWPDVLPLDIRKARALRVELNEVTKAFAALSCRVLNRCEISPISREPIWYRERLVSKGLLSAGRQIESKCLTQWARNVLGNHLHHLGLSDGDKDCHWMPLMLRPRESIPFIPLKHVILETLLNLPCDATEMPLNYVPTGMSAKPTKRADTLYASALRKVINCYRMRGERVRVIDALREVGCFEPFRHNKSRFPKIGEVVAKLRESNASARGISPA